MVGPGKPIDTNRFFVICSNILGSVITSYSIHYTKLYELGLFGEPERIPAEDMPQWLSEHAQGGVGRAAGRGDDGGRVLQRLPGDEIPRQRNNFV